MTKRKATAAPQPIQTTPTGHEIPVPQRSAVLGALRKAARPAKHPAAVVPGDLPKE